MTLIVGPKSGYDNKRVVKGRFIYQNLEYILPITDPEIERSYLAMSNGEYELSSPIICVSLGDPFEGYYYKLIATIFTQ